ncbi:hypothetical protein FGB62_301g08 [Gracilaria domingensis]|nr:hypothetical protein FGB62_301g08 [Gracilaria domingensis]
MVAVSIDGIAYYVAYKKRFKLTDLAWVCQRTLTGTVEAMQKGITRVSGAVGALKKETAQRLREVEGYVNRVQVALADQIDRDVGAVKDGVREVGDETACVKSALGDTNQRMDQLENKIDFATNGIVALVKALSTTAPDRIKPGSPFYDLKRHRLSAGGLRGLLTEEHGGDNDIAGKRRSIDMKSSFSLPHLLCFSASVTLINGLPA